MFKFLCQLPVRHPWKVCLIWLVFAGGVTIVAPNWQENSHDDDIRFLPPSYASVRGYHLLERAFPQDVFASRVIFAIERADAPLTETDYALIDQAVEALQELRRQQPELQISSIVSHREPLMGKRLISADRHCILIQVSLNTPYVAIQTALSVEKAEEVIRPIFSAPGSPTLHVTGPAGIGRDLLVASARSLDHTTVATIALVIVVLLLIYRSPMLALVPLVTIGVATWVALQVLALVTLIPGVQLVNISQVFSIVILFGAGTDYCLFLISRYQEELHAGAPKATALSGSLHAVAGALLASAGTVMVGLGLMGFAEFRKISCAGPVIAIGLAIALAASLTLTPALLSILGRRAFWPREINPGLPKAASDATWNRISRFVIHHPVLVLTATLAVMTPFAIIGLKVQPSFRPTGDLSPKSKSVQGVATIARRFPAGESGPITVLLVSPSDWNTPEGRQQITQLCRGFARIDNVAEVRSLTQPLGQPLPDFATPNPPPAHASPTMKLLQNFKNDVSAWFATPFRRAQQHYAARVDGLDGGEYVTRLDIVMKSDPFAAESFETLQQIETWLQVERPPTVHRAEVYGVTVYARDMEQIIQRDRLKVNLLVLAGVFVILLVVVRKLWLAVYLLATVLLSYYATLGCTALFSCIWADKPFGVIEWRVPFFLFTILVAIGEDYNILMVTRAFQERLRWGPIEGLRRGLAKTGGTITACGLIMAGTFGTLMIGELGTLVEIGFALALGVILDTFLVRTFLVPAFMLLMWKDEAPAEEQPAPAVRRDVQTAAA